MMSGLRPVHSVATITCTSEMSGTASSGVDVMVQIPHTVSATVPVNTRNRLLAHQSMILLIMVCLRVSKLLRRHRELLSADDLAASRDGDGDIPSTCHQYLRRSP